jgi:hypothetical protein
MMLSNERVRELYDHNKRLIETSGGEVGVAFNGGVPVLHTNSKLLWYPSLSIVCVSPINEVDEDEEEGGCCKDVDVWEPHRPIFYTEINAAKFNIVKGRFRIKQKRITKLINSK